MTPSTKLGTCAAKGAAMVIETVTLVPAFKIWKWVGKADTSDAKLGTTTRSAFVKVTLEVKTTCSTTCWPGITVRWMFCFDQRSGGVPASVKLGNKRTNNAKRA